MKKFLFFFLIISLVSCKKNDTVQSSLTARTLTNVSYGSDAAQMMDLYLPAGRSTDSTRLLVLIHGGAWTVGDKSDFDSFLPSIKQRLPDYAIANINYRLATATANHFPAQENDMKSAMDFLIQKSGEYHVSQKLVLLGVSAGAHMALLQAYKYASPRIQAVIDFFGPTDMTDLYNFLAGNPSYQNIFQTLMNGTPSTNASLYAQSSPINFVSAQSCPTIIFHGDADDLVPIEQSIDLKNKLNSFGIAAQLNVYPNEGHTIWPSDVMNDALDKAELFLKANVH